MSQQTATQAPAPTLAELVEHLMEFDGPPEQFLLHLLAVQCQVGHATSGAVLRLNANGEPEVLAVYPPLEASQTAPVWLAQTVEILPGIVDAGQIVVRPVQSTEDLYEEQPRSQLILMPIRGGGGVRGSAAFLIHAQSQAQLRQCRERLELTISLLSLYEMRLTLQVRRADMQRMREAYEVLAAINEQTRFKAAGMAFCNEVAARWTANRVSLGFLRGRYVKLATMSHTEKIIRKTKLVQEIEYSMEECLDQDQEVLAPAGSDVSYVNRAARELSANHGPSTILSLPMRKNGEVVAVVTVERAPDQAFTLDEVETLRLVCDLSAARIVDLDEHDKWIGPKVAGQCRKGLVVLVGPSHTWVKALAIGISGLLLFLCLADGAYRADANFEIEATGLRVVPAPFNGILYKVHVKPGDPVQAGQLLAELETSELIWQLTAAESDQNRFLKEADAAMSARKINEWQVAEARAKSQAARKDLLRYQIEKAQIKSPINGVVLTGDLSKLIGAPVDVGSTLLEVAPLDSLRAKLLVAEKWIADVVEVHHPLSFDVASEDQLIGDLNQRNLPESLWTMFDDRGQRLSDKARISVEEEGRQWSITDQNARYTLMRQGETLHINRSPASGSLAPKTDPSHYVDFLVERINPVAEVVGSSNVFQVRAKLLTTSDGSDDRYLKPGIGGVAKIDLGQRRYAWIWTRDLVNWVRMKLWLWGLWVERSHGDEVEKSKSRRVEEPE